MKEVDYIIVGLGIAGLSLCERLIKNKKSFLVFDNDNVGSTMVSGGVFNPVVLKRFTPAWMANEHLEPAKEFYSNLEKKLDISIVEFLPIYRIFNSVEEQNNWMVASDKNELKNFLLPNIKNNTNKYITAPFGLGEVRNGGKIHPTLLFSAYRDYLRSKDMLITEDFDHEKLCIDNEVITYKEYSAKKIVFAEGASAIKNPFFPNHLLIGNKGEYLIIKAPRLKMKHILKGNMFLIPLGKDLYKAGATFNKEDLGLMPTVTARDEIKKALAKMISAQFEIVDQITGIRPTTKDRKPLLGSLPINKNVIFFNGLGTRGIMGAPWLSELLFKSMEGESSLPATLDINRFA